MEGHHWEWWQVPAGESPVTMINDGVLNLFFRLFLLVVIEFHRMDIDFVIIPNLQETSVQHLLGKMIKLRFESKHLRINGAVFRSAEGIQALFETVTGRHIEIESTSKQNGYLPL